MHFLSKFEIIIYVFLILSVFQKIKHISQQQQQQQKINNLI